jgi:hypothetical protein
VKVEPNLGGSKSELVFLGVAGLSRAPLVSGMMWVTALLVTDDRLRAAVLQPPSKGSGAGELLHAWNGGAVPIVLIGASYVVGLISVGLTTPVLAYFGERLRKAYAKATRAELIHAGGGTYRLKYRRPAWLFQRLDRLPMRLGLHTWPLSQPSRSLLIDAINSALTRDVLKGESIFAFPLEAAVDSLPHTAAQLAVTAPAQYEEVERSRLDSLFRAAIVPPLLALAVVVPTSNHLAWVAVGIVVSGVLLIQSLGERRAVFDLLATAAYLGHVTIPLVDTVVEGLGRLNPQPRSSSEQMVALVVVLQDRGFYDESETAMREIVGELAGSDKFDADAAYRFLVGHDPETAADFARRMERSQDWRPGA